MSVGEPIGPVVRMRQCDLPTCGEWFQTPHGGDWPPGFCSHRCHRSSKNPVAPKRAGLVTAPNRGARTRKVISPASPQQRAKRDAGRSIVSDAAAGLDPAHLTPRTLGGCDHPDCTVPLTRGEHRSFDDGQLDLLPFLLRARSVREIQHAVGHYNGNILALLARLTGTRWAPTGQPAASYCQAPQESYWKGADVQFCDDHRARLHDLIRQRGLQGWVPPDVDTAAAQLQDRLQRGEHTPVNFDPLLDAHWAIFGNLLGTYARAGGNPVELMALDGCPLCKVNELHALTCTDARCSLDHQAGYDWMLERAVDDAQRKVRMLEATG